MEENKVWESISYSTMILSLNPPKDHNETSIHERKFFTQMGEATFNN